MMKRMVAVVCLGALCMPVLAGRAALAAATPMDAALKDDGVTHIECMVVDKTENLPIFASTSEDPTKSGKDAAYHYDLYLPKGYSENKDRRYACMFIADAGGNANMGVLAERFKRDEWIVVMLKESRNDSPEWYPNFLAAHDDAVKRVRVAKGLKFATGFSGGARCSSINCQLRPGFSGVICQAAAFAYNTKPYDFLYEWFPPHILVAGTFGDADGNLNESYRMRHNLPLSRVNITLYKGGHGHSPADVFGSCMDWMEQGLFLDPRPPVPPRQPTKVGKAVPYEGVEADGYQWYLRKCRRQLDETKEGPARFMALTRIIEVVNKGRLTSDKEIAESLKKWQAELNEIRNTQPVRDFENKALRAYQAAAAADEALARQMASTRIDYSGKMAMSGVEKQLLNAAIAAHRAVVEQHADSIFAAESKLRLTSLEIDLAKVSPPPPAKK